MSNIINVVIKDAETPEDDIIVPDTGWYTSSTESNNTGSSFVAPFIGIGVISFVVLVLLILAKRKLKTSLKCFGLLSTLAVLVMGASIYGAITNVVSATDNLISITSSDTTITVVRGAEGEETDATYGVATATIKLNETTPLGYTIFAYTPDGNVLTADAGDGTIEPVATNNSVLTNNTWGIALTDQADIKAEDSVWNKLEDESNPLLVASFDESTTTGTTVTLRYGVLVDNTLPVGVYSANIEYKAYQRAYNITFDPGEGEITAPTKPVIIGEPIGELPTPTRTHYNFLGWYTEETGGTKIDESTVPTQNSTYYAHWERITYTISFNSGEGTIISGDASKTVQAGEPLGTLPEATRDNYAFIGWYTAETGGERVTTATIPTEGTSYYAHWSRDTYTITFNAGEGTIDAQDAERSINAGDAIGTLPDATRTNYTLDGWYTAETGGTKITAETTPASTTTYYAHWNRIEYTITFDLNGGNIGGDTTNPTATVQAGDTLGNLPQTPSKTNYAFAGWWTAENDGDPVTAETRPDGTTTYFARWNRIEYTITFDLNGGNIGGDTTNPTATVQAGDTLGNLPAGPSKDNHTFAGWWTNETGGTQVTTETRPDSTTTYFAHWDRIEYEITFDLNGGNISGDTTNPTATVQAGNSLGTLPSEPARTNYTFAGWYTQLDGGTPIDTNTTPTGTATYFAHWNRIEYEITFDLNGGNISGDTTNPTATVYAGDALSNLPTEPTKNDFVFAGWWTTEIEGGTQVTAETIPSGATTYFAHWILANVTVAFDTDGGSTVLAQTLTPGEKATRPATNPTKSGYNFVDWYTNDSYSTLFDFDTPINTNTTVYARFVEDRYVAEMNGDVYETIQSAVDVAPSSQTTIRLLADTSEKVTIESGQDIILNLNSETLSYPGSGENVIINKGNLALENGTVSSTGGKGMINNNAGATLTTRNVNLAITTTTPKQAIYNNGGTAYILEGTNIETQSSSAGAIDNHGGTMVIENARIVSTGTRQGVYNDNNGFLEIRGANTYISAKPDVGSTNRAAVQSVNGSLVIIGGTIVSKDYAVTVQDGSFRLGTQDNAYNDENPEIRGGKYGIQSSVNYSVYDGIIEGKTAAVNDETKITGKETNYGKVNDTKDIDGTTYQTIYYETETEYTITFNLNGGNINGSTTNPTATVQIGDTLGSLPSEPTRTNYTFDGWYTELNGGTKITANTRPAESRSYFAHWNKIEYTITFDLNGGNINGSTTNPTATVYAGETLGTFPTEPTRTNYTFDGWFTTETGGDEVTAGTISTGTTTYFAHWTLVAVTFDDAYAAAGKTRDAASGKYTLQDMGNTICNAVSKSKASDYSDTQETQLVDLRDGKVYWVAKLLDGHCWMTQNLDLDLDYRTVLIHASSDIGWGSDTSTMSWTPERSTIPKSYISSYGKISGWIDDDDNPYSVDTGDWYWIGNWKNNGTGTWYSEDCNRSPNCNYLSGNENGKFSTSPYAGNGTHGHVGNYYNWTAAIASNDSSSYNTSTLADITNNPQNSICPAGWRLPTVSDATDADGSTNEFRKLIISYDRTAYNDKISTASPLWFVRAGGVGSSSGSDNLKLSGWQGAYWSSTVYNSYNPYFLDFDPSIIHSAAINYKHFGNSVRCVARDMSPTTLITFNANGGVVEGGNTTTHRITDGQALGTLPEATKDGRTFDGWYTAMDGGTEITDQTVPTGAITYYAHWVTSFNNAYAAAGMSKDDTSDKYKMHEMIASICEAVTTGQTSELVDVRDGTVYHVGKLADDRCWLLDNLALDAVAAKNSLSPTNTNATQAAIDNFKADSGTAPQVGWATTAVSYETSSSAYNQPHINIASKDLTRSDLTNPSDPLTVADDWKYGVYYNYCAASVSTYCYASGSGVDADPTSAIDVKNDICPAGWRMPTGNSYDATTRPDGGEYQTLYDAYPTISGGDDQYTRFRKAFRLPLSGSFVVVSPYNQDSLAYIWSSTFGGGDNMYYLRATKSSIGPISGNNRVVGQPVRCVADNVLKNLITFNANGGVVEGGDTATRRIVENQALGTLPETTREGYAFDGWYTEMEGGTVITSQTVPTGTTTYYAHWIVSFDDAYAAAGKTRDATSGKYKIQDMNKNICDAVSTSTKSDYSDTQETQLVDIRDGKTYWVAKLLDGHCWMTQNLDLDLETTANKVQALTSENTDLNTFGSNGYDTSNGYSKDANDVITWTPERNTIPTSSISSTGSISGWSYDNNNPYSIDTGDWYWIGNWKNNGEDTWYESTTNNYLDRDNSGAGDKFSTTEYTGNGKHGHIGNYYNWSASIASNNSTSYNASTIADITTNPQNSICPFGWRLPTVSYASGVGSTNEFERLTAVYGYATGNDKVLTAAPLWFVRGGDVYSNILRGPGTIGYYWSSTVYSNNYSYNVYFRSNNVDTMDYLNRSYGWSVRCIAR